MAVRCKKQFEYQECDGDGFSTGKYGYIDEGEEFDDYNVDNAYLKTMLTIEVKGADDEEV